ncbi:hypothetical protein FAIPA1_510002 [Frankia sp. AiPs1]|uniref:hypothetical protein n=1 Tax=Frankia sp. AiPa1 TaxID=573492 RepID=UPI00202B8215|nr:hypothetical protein [Frankia sp. AiPa1]MCL9759089.1 hypothetical protein [Frankia sp. AiPa1]
MIDLHVESVHSGPRGAFPADLMAQAVRAGATVVGLADRNTVEGVDLARTALPAGLTLVAAATVPCGVVVHGQARTIELRAYLMNLGDPVLLDLLARARQAREACARMMINSVGVRHSQLTWARMMTLTRGGNRTPNLLIRSKVWIFL